VDTGGRPGGAGLEEDLADGVGVPFGGRRPALGGAGHRLLTPERAGRLAAHVDLPGVDRGLDPVEGRSHPRAVLPNHRLLGVAEQAVAQARDHPAGDAAHTHFPAAAPAAAARPGRHKLIKM
jgi:hypothetical protein